MPFTGPSNQEKATFDIGYQDLIKLIDLCPKRGPPQLQILQLFYILIFMSYLQRLSIILVILTLSHHCLAQQNQTNSSAGYTSYFDLGLKAGSFLPSKITGVRDILPLWGVKMGHPVSQELALEYDIDMAMAKGVTYYMAYLSLRHDFAVGDAIPLFVLVGFDGHYYKRKNTLITQTEFPFKFSTGWHIGVGGEAQIYRDLLARIDFRMGFSPGRQMTMTFGVIFRY